MRAVQLALQRFRHRGYKSCPTVGRQQLSGLTEQTRVASQPYNLSLLAEEILMYFKENIYHDISDPVPGHLNVRADRLLRPGGNVTMEWILSPEVATRFESLSDMPLVDLFATADDKQCPIFVCPFQDRRAWRVDALSFRRIFSTPTLSLRSYGNQTNYHSVTPS